MEKYVLITGASSGIGYDLARVFAREGHNLVVSALEAGTLNAVADGLRKSHNVDVVPIAKDLSIHTGPQELYDEIKGRGIEIGILVNDAGAGEHGPFVETDLQREMAIIQLNINTVVCLTKLYLKDMLAGSGGRILQLASVASVMPHPLMAVYGGTKAFVLSFTEALANELKDTNVTVTALMPGPTDTDFFENAGAEDTKAAQIAADPAKVAEDGYKALMAGDLKVVSGFMNKVQVTMSRVMPDTMTTASTRKLMEEEKK